MPAQNFLLVDDDADDIEMLADALKAIVPDIEIKAMSNGYDALQWLQVNDERPDYIFLDLNMPKLSGIQCLKKMQESGMVPQIPVVIYTTSKQKEDKERCLALGAACFITKPSSFKSLVETLTHVLNKQWQLL